MRRSCVDADVLAGWEAARPCSDGRSCPGSGVSLGRSASVCGPAVSAVDLMPGLQPDRPNARSTRKLKMNTAFIGLTPLLARQPDLMVLVGRHDHAALDLCLVYSPKLSALSSVGLELGGQPTVRCIGSPASDVEEVAWSRACISVGGEHIEST